MEKSFQIDDFWKKYLDAVLKHSVPNQALNALVFLYDQVLKEPLGLLGDFAKAKRPQRLPVSSPPFFAQALHTAGRQAAAVFMQCEAAETG